MTGPTIWDCLEDIRNPSRSDERGAKCPLISAEDATEGRHGDGESVVRKPQETDPAEVASEGERDKAPIGNVTPTGG